MLKIRVTKEGITVEKSIDQIDVVKSLVGAWLEVKTKTRKVMVTSIDRYEQDLSRRRVPVRTPFRRG
jgi:hypothetical protein